jgi:membrane protein YqaA with SNARE-associated domain
VAAFLFLYVSQPNFLKGHLESAAADSVWVGYGLYLLIGSIHGFALIPSATLVLAAIPLFRPIPLFAMTLLGILTSSASIYYFSESLHLDEYFEGRHRDAVGRMKRTFQKNEMPIIGWSFFPLAPADLICYVCGLLRVNFAIPGRHPDRRRNDMWTLYISWRQCTAVPAPADLMYRQLLPPLWIPLKLPHEIQRSSRLDTSSAKR